jgi:hypothetical protein
MSETYGIDSRTYNRLPPEDQAAVRAEYEDRQADAGTVDPVAVADRVLSAESGDYTGTLLRELEHMSPENAQLVLQELERREPDGDWVQIVNTGALNDVQGTNYPERGLRVLADALALEHAAGRLDESELYSLFGHGMHGFEQQHATGAQMLFNASNSTEMQAFERAMADFALDTLAGADRHSANHGEQTGITGVASIITKGLGGDYFGREALASAYADTDAGTAGIQSRNAEERAHIRTLLGDKGSLYGDQPNNPDPLAVLMRGVAEMYGEVDDGGTNLAVEFVDWAAENQDFFVRSDVFGTTTSDPRAEALALLTSNHAEAVFADLTDGYARGDQYAGDDGRKLGFLLSLTAFNGSNSGGERVTRALDAYTQGLVDQVRQDPASQAAQEPLGRLEILSPALLIAQASPYLRDLASNEARVNGILRVLDIVSTGAGFIPVASMPASVASFLAQRYGDVNGLTDDQIKEGLRDYLTTAFSGSPQQREAALRDIAAITEAQIAQRYGDVPVVAGAMTRRVEDTVYDMLVAIANNDVAGFMQTLNLDG